MCSKKTLLQFVFTVFCEALAPLLTLSVIYYDVDAPNCRVKRISLFAKNMKFYFEVSRQSLVDFYIRNTLWTIVSKLQR